MTQALSMSDLRGFLDDRDDADIQKLFDAFYETDTSLSLIHI